MTTTDDAQTSTPPMGPSRVLLSVEEAADRLSLSRTRVYALLGTGAIRSVRVGRLRRIPAEALTKFVAQLIDASRAKAPER